MLLIVKPSLKQQYAKTIKSPDAKTPKKEVHQIFFVTHFFIVVSVFCYLTQNITNELIPFIYSKLHLFRF